MGVKVNFPSGFYWHGEKHRGLRHPPKWVVTLLDTMSEEVLLDACRFTETSLLIVTLLIEVSLIEMTAQKIQISKRATLIVRAIWHN